MVGHRAREVMRGLAHLVRFIENREHRLPCGASVRAAAPFITERTLLVMADHLFAPSMLAPLVGLPASGDELVLAIDRARGGRKAPAR